MKIIFLDIDGVLRVIPKDFDKYGGDFHETFIDNLRNIIQKTEAYIVISASMRTFGLSYMIKMWKYRNYPGEIIGITPSSEERHRGKEIKFWLDNCIDPIESYVILDDDTDMLLEQLNHFVKTSDNKHHKESIDIGYGLTKECAEQAIEILLK